ncbi:putative membrane protein [Kribbella steppae]|uniref:Putative membrane protein n=1 Tax=Kribbella steppae TaxID=2512223 RepID=A0A4R2HTA3_9ACTN|nr:DUF998 domain-containing protein [Kribbella steppae]TCO34544.1 putative membrane protein [Kribbella steppae]
MSALQDAHRRNQESAGGRLQERPDWSLSLAAWAGIIGPVLFTATFLAQEAFRRSEYSPLAEPVSALEAGPNGWIQQVNFVVFGLLTIACAVGLHRGLQPTRAGIAGPALLFLSGIGCLLAATFPLRQDAAGVTYDPGGHIVAGFLFFMTSAVGLIVVSRRLAHDPRWRSLATYSLVTGIVALVGFLAGGGLVMPDGAPLHDWAGLYQRVLVVAVVFPCRILLSIRLLATATPASHPS